MLWREIATLPPEIAGGAAKVVAFPTGLDTVLWPQPAEARLSLPSSGCCFTPEVLQPTFDLGCRHIQVVLLYALNQRGALHSQQLGAAGHIAIRLLQRALNQILLNVAQHAL